jgi:hypothetical protein
MRWSVVAVLMCAGQATLAQRVGPLAGPADEGTVVGHVYLADTGGPARLATVALQPVEVKSDDRPYEERRKDGGFRLYRTGMDGGYRIPHVRPGTYYVVVKQPGYLSPFAQFSNKQLSHPSMEDQQKITSMLPTVLVVANNTATMNIHLTRGASLSGAVKFDDGSPYPGTSVGVLQKDDKGAWQNLTLASGGETDDQGLFRITGLLEGDYLLEVSLRIDDTYVSSLLGQVQGMSAASHYALTFYNGETARQRDAKPIHLDSSQEMTSADVTIPVSKLHAVTGAIIEAKSGRAINSGNVEIYYADEGGEQVASVKVEPDEPVFIMPFVPEGVYTIKVKDATDVSREEVSNGTGAMPPTYTRETVLRKYGPAEQPLTVTADVSGVNLTVRPVTKTPYRL